MKTPLAVLALGMAFLLSCSNKPAFLSGSWTIENLNSVDTSANVETLLATFIPTHYTDRDRLSFNSGKVIMSDSGKKESGLGRFRLTNNDTYVVIHFPSDAIESRYEIKDISDNSITLSATHEGETVNMLLRRTETGR